MLNRYVSVAPIAVLLFFAANHSEALAAPFQAGDFVTFSQGDWGTSSTAGGMTLSSAYDTVYASTFGILEVGIPGASGFSMAFTAPNAVFAHLPSNGQPSPLTADLVDPITSASGVFGGEVVALRLNVDFSDAGYLPGSLGIPFGDLVIHDYAAMPHANGLTVRQLLDLVNLGLGGAVVAYGLDDANTLLQDLNVAFSEGQFATQFAQDHLAIAETGTVPEPATVSVLGIGLASLVVRRLKGKAGTNRR